MSKHDAPIVRLAAQHVFQIFRDARPDNPLVFHNFGRARALVDACREIAEGAKLDDGDIPVLLLAAWFLISFVGPELQWPDAALRLSALYYYGTPLVHGLQASSVLGLIAVSALALALGALRFVRKDIAV